MPSLSRGLNGRTPPPGSVQTALWAWVRGRFVPHAHPWMRVLALIPLPHGASAKLNHICPIIPMCRRLAFPRYPTVCGRRSTLGFIIIFLDRMAQMSTTRSDGARYDLFEVSQILWPSRSTKRVN